MGANPCTGLGCWLVTQTSGMKGLSIRTPPAPRRTALLFLVCKAESQPTQAHPPVPLWPHLAEPTTGNGRRQR